MAGLHLHWNFRILNVCYEHQMSLSTLKTRYKALDLHWGLLIPWRVIAIVEEVCNAVKK